MDGLTVSSFFLVTLMLVQISSKKILPIETFNISFESTQNKQQYGTKITCTKEGGGGGGGGGVMVS